MIEASRGSGEGVQSDSDGRADQERACVHEDFICAELRMTVVFALHNMSRVIEESAAAPRKYHGRLGGFSCGMGQGRRGRGKLYNGS